MLNSGRQIAWFLFIVGLIGPVVLLVQSISGHNDLDDSVGVLVIYLGAWTSFLFIRRCLSISRRSAKAKSDLENDLYRHVTAEVEAKHFDHGLMTRVQIERSGMSAYEIQVAYIRARVDWLASRPNERQTLVKPESQVWRKR